jgi:hypothetical protein
MKNLFLILCMSLLFQASFPVFAQLQKDVRYTYEVTIGKKTEAEFWLTEVDNVVFGEIRYKKGKKPIPLRGEQLKGRYRVLEFDSTGMISGVITGDLTRFRGNVEWFSPQTRTVLPIRLRVKQKTTLPESLRPRLGFTEGVYTFQYGTDDYVGHLSVERSGKDSVVLEINNVTGEPSHNLATIDPVKVLIQNNEIIYSINVECEFRIRFFNSVAIVNYVNGKSRCGFGMNASVDGIYWLSK